MQCNKEEHAAERRMATVGAADPHGWESDVHLRPHSRSFSRKLSSEI